MFPTIDRSFEASHIEDLSLLTLIQKNNHRIVIKLLYFESDVVQKQIGCTVTNVINFIKSLPCRQVKIRSNKTYVNPFRIGLRGDTIYPPPPRATCNSL